MLYLFIVLISYFIMITPVEMIFDGFDDADFGEADSYKDDYMPLFRTSFTIAIAALFACPVTWLAMKIFSRDPNYYQYRRY